MTTTTIPLKNSDRVATIDVADLPIVAPYSWRLMKTHTDGKFYAQATGPKIDGKPTTIMMHRLLMKDELEAADGKRTVDHQNGDGLTNTRENMRVATYVQNNANAGLNSRNTTGYKGVSLVRNGRYTAQVSVNNKSKHIGTFDFAADAAMAYDAKMVELHGAFAQTNESMGLLPTFVDMTAADLAIIRSVNLANTTVEGDSGLGVEAEGWGGLEITPLPAPVSRWHAPQRTRSLRRSSKPSILGRIVNILRKVA